MHKVTCNCAVQPTRRHILQTFVRTATVLGAPGLVGCAFSIEGELPNITVTQKNLTIPPAPRVTETGESAITLPFSPSRGKLNLPVGTFKEVRALGFQLRPVSGVTGFSFLRSLRARIDSPAGYAAGATSAIEVSEYERSLSEPLAAGVLDLPSTTNPDITAHWQAESYVVILDLAGQLPTTAWTLDIALFLRARIEA